jgi:hypothetical protein
VTEQAPEGKDREQEEALDEAAVVVRRAVVVRWGAAALARAENAYAPVVATRCPIRQVLPVTRFDVLNVGRQ